MTTKSLPSTVQTRGGACPMKIGESFLKSKSNVKEDKGAESKFKHQKDKGAESESISKKIKGPSPSSIPEEFCPSPSLIIRALTKAKKGTAQASTHELIRENEELRDQIQNLTGKVPQPGLGQDHVASIPRSLLENGINSNGCAKERNQTDQNHHIEEACHGNEELRNFDGNTRKEHIHTDKCREGRRRSEPQAPAESQHNSSRPRVERGHSRSTFRRHADNEWRTRQRTCEVEMNDSRHSRYLHDYLKRLEERILGMQRNQTDNRNPDPLVELQSPFVARIREAIAHRRFEMPQIPHYEGHSDPMIHMQLYRGLMEVRGANEDVMCKFFPLTLGGTSLKWFNKLKPSNIQNFPQMCREFIKRFRGARPLERKPNVLRDIKQGESETLKEYVERFHKEVINLGAYDEENTLEDFIRTYGYVDCGSTSKTSDQKTILKLINALCVSLRPRSS
ncbi:hypothetical protein LWI29_032693 [Acer saccharum]|uniref:Retrotransposon gag domain-containing protein n=1 Tax=Acer saccharum TaxID=4024 RepID=A0AA39T7V0_ACESA|nr:hypothetical protein LWI29_032693 [Acer saccharum]